MKEVSTLGLESKKIKEIYYIPRQEFINEFKAKFLGIIKQYYSDDNIKKDAEDYFDDDHTAINFRDIEIIPDEDGEFKSKVSIQVDYLYVTLINDMMIIAAITTVVSFRTSHTDKNEIGNLLKKNDLFSGIVYPGFNFLGSLISNITAIDLTVPYIPDFTSPDNHDK
ncbi:hypothetical protein [Lacticaseibacillus paracasei]|uniref:hypothetical protein n=1 Tax=Lacticaseibacillus paracasei TaxID=1597 RepID=UPI0031E0EC82